jgi:hypothetical protein
MEIEILQQKIYEIRGQRVMLDFDLAILYEVKTKSLNLAVKRNLKRFPNDFMFQVTKDELDVLRFQNETSKGSGGARYLPYAFTEQGLAMLSGILKSYKAIEVNISIMRAFVFMRKYALSNLDLSQQLKQLETLYNKQFDDVFEAINYLMKKDNLVKQQIERKKIGF